jgi:predicted XRE-type DNA-binding protein
MRNGSKGRNVRTVKSPDKSVLYEVGGENVFADLGLPNPELTLAKAKLVLRLNECIQGQKLSHARVARFLGIERAQLETLLRGRTEKYTLDQLFQFLVALGQHVEITIRPDSSLSRIA